MPLINEYPVVLRHCQMDTCAFDRHRARVWFLHCSEPPVKMLLCIEETRKERLLKLLILFHK